MKKRLGVVLFLIFLSSSLSAQKTRFGQGLPHAKPGVDYPIKLHISGVRVRVECDGAGDCGRTLRADALLNGEKVELSGTAFLSRGFYRVVVLPGDYQARLQNAPHPVAGTPFFQEYEILLPDRTVWGCWVSGLFE
jgi:hypothetical protein